MIDQKDQEFFRVFSMVLGVLTVIAGVAMFIAFSVVGDPTDGDPRYEPEQVAARVAPVGQVRVSGDPAVTAGSTAEESSKPTGPRSGAEIVANTCAGCHGSGVMSAPKLGDKAAWGKRYSAGFDHLVSDAINGIRQMPPRGGCGDCSDDEIHDAVLEMLHKAGVSVSEKPRLSADSSKAAAATETSVTEQVKQVASDAGDAVKAAASTVGEAASSAAESTVNAAESAANQAMDATKSTISAITEAVTPAAPAVDLAAGQQLYNSSCIGCHGSGVAGAPVAHNKSAWAPRIANGLDALVNSAINGKGAMPPRGGCFNCSDSQLRNAIAFMNQ